MIGKPIFSPSFDKFISDAVRLSMRLKLAPKRMLTADRVWRRGGPERRQNYARAGQCYGE